MHPSNGMSGVKEVRIPSRGGTAGGSGAKRQRTGDASFVASAATQVDDLLGTFSDDPRLGEVDAVPSAKQVYIAFIQDAERAGIAYYDTSEGALCATSVSCPLIDLPWVCQVLKQQVSNPSLIITSSSVNTAVRDELAKPCDMGDAEGAAKPINVHIMKHTVFSLDAACKVLNSVRLPKLMAHPATATSAATGSSSASAPAASALPSSRPATAAGAIVAGAGGVVRAGASGRPSSAAAYAASAAAAIDSDDDAVAGIAPINVYERQLRVPFAPSASAGAEALARLRLGALLDMNDGHLVRAAGGLLHFLAERHIIDDAMPVAPIELPLGTGGRPASGLGGSAGSAAAPGMFTPLGPGTIALAGGLRMFSLTDFMHMDALTAASLAIFAPGNHPAMLAHAPGGSASGAASFAAAGSTAAATAVSAGRSGRRPTASSAPRDGLSLYGLLDRTVSTAGRRMLRTWCMQPSVDIEIIRHRHDAVAFCIAAQQQQGEMWRELVGHIRRARDVGRLILRIKNVKAGPSDWFALQQTILAANIMKDAIRLLLDNVRAVPGAESAARPSTAASRPPPTAASTASSATASGDYSANSPFLLRQILVEFSADLLMIQSVLDGVIDWESSRAEGKLVVKRGLDEVLDAHRNAHEDMPQVLGSVAVGELERYSTLTSLACRYIPQIGCVLVVDKLENGLKAPTAAVAVGPQQPALKRMEDVIPGDFEFQFETAEALCFKNETMRQLDTEYGDIAATISDMQASIVRQLEEKVLEQEALLLTVGTRIAELDVIASFASAARDYGYTRPKVTDDTVLIAKAARHPLLERRTETSFTPNDIVLAPGHTQAGSVAIVTGPNWSGKSIYLKTVGLLTYMAQIGSFVPAERAVVGVVDRMFSRIQGFESASFIDQSTFTIDLNQVGLMLRHATPRSLLLLDEFGKGTSSVDGVALLTATIRGILRLKRPMPPLPSSDARPPTADAPIYPPKTLITTHFREILDHNLIAGVIDAPVAAVGASSSSAGGGGAAAASSSGADAVSRHLSFYQMKVLLDRKHIRPATSGAGAVDTSVVSSDAAEPLGTDEYDDNVVPLFQLVPGRSLSSYGLACAARAGLVRPVIDRAHEITILWSKRAAIAPLPAYVESAERAAREWAQMKVIQTLLEFPVWAAVDDSDASRELLGATKQATDADVWKLVQQLHDLASVA